MSVREAIENLKADLAANDMCAFTARQDLEPVFKSHEDLRRVAVELIERFDQMGRYGLDEITLSILSDLEVAAKRAGE